MPLVTANAELLETILDGTYPIWNEGLTRTDYGKWNRAQMASDWGRAHLRRVALVEGGRLLASAKRYDLRASLAGVDVEVLGVGAVFTPPDLRGRGHARALLDLMHDDARARGCVVSLLFSEIGSAYYEGLGYRVVPTRTVTVHVIRKPGAPATLVRAGESRDLPEIAAIAAARPAQNAAFRLDRSADLIEFGLTRRRLLAGLGRPGVRSVEFFVAEEGMRAVAFVVITRGPNGALLEDCGDRDPAGARVGAMLQVLAARTPAEIERDLTSWFPSSMHPPQLVLTKSAPINEVMMLRRLGEGPAIEDSPDADYRLLDVF